MWTTMSIFGTDLLVVIKTQFETFWMRLLAPFEGICEYPMLNFNKCLRLVCYSLVDIEKEGKATTSFAFSTCVQFCIRDKFGYHELIDFIYAYLQEMKDEASMMKMVLQKIFIECMDLDVSNDATYTWKINLAFLGIKQFGRGGL